MSVQFMIIVPDYWTAYIIITIIIIHTITTMIMAVWWELYAQIRQVVTVATVQMDTLEMEDGSALVAMVYINFYWVCNYYDA